MRREILLNDGTVKQVDGINYRDHFFIYFSEGFDYWVVSHNPTKRAVTYGLKSYRECKHFIDGMHDLIDDWSFKDAKDVDGCDAETVRQYILTYSNVRSWK